MRNESKIRKYDEKSSEIVSDFLDRYFYNGLSEVERIYDKERQIKGIDIEFILNGKKYFCDEKAAISYANKNLKTFAFELSFINKAGKLNEGWLIDKHKVNNSFMLIWINHSDYNKINNISELREIEIALIDKNTLLEHIKGLGWNINNLYKKDKRIRLNVNENKGNIYKNGCKFTLTENRVEKPINIILDKKDLIDLSDFHKILYQ